MSFLQTSLSFATFFTEGAGIVLVGFVMVLIVLTFLCVACMLMGMGFKRYDARTQRLTSKREQEIAEAALPPHIWVALSAAVHVSMGPSARIVRVDSQASRDWAREGRRRLFASHKLR